MKYTKIQVSCKDAKDELYRKLYVREDIGLVELGCVICATFRAEFCHSFFYIANKKTYNPDAFMDDFVRENDEPMKDYGLSDLPNKFLFVYDSGEDWVFDCKIMDEHVDFPNKQVMAMFIEGSGYGLWEDNKFGFYNFLNGQYDLNMSRAKWEDSINRLEHQLERCDYADEDADEKLSELYNMFPWNLKISSLKKWSKQLTEDSENRNLSDRLNKALKIYKDEIESGYNFAKHHGE